MGNPAPKNIYDSEWVQQETPRGTWRYLDISGDHLGLRMEKLAPGETSSIHHYHTLEEEHVIAIEGNATLILGIEELALKRGDHTWFRAGDEVGHHIVNRSSDPFTFLVIGERKRGDVCFYPEHGVANVKALNSGWKQFDVEQRTTLLQASSSSEGR